ncbi:hypothetical protein SRHO_G00128560 [Serrasalmus rhombeus]
MGVKGVSGIDHVDRTENGPLAFGEQANQASCLQSGAGTVLDSSPHTRTTVSQQKQGVKTDRALTLAGLRGFYVAAERRGPRSGPDKSSRPRSLPSEIARGPPPRESERAKPSERPNPRSRDQSSRRYESLGPGALWAPWFSSAERTGSSPSSLTQEKPRRAFFFFPQSRSLRSFSIAG